MGHETELELHTARKAHCCDWCGQRIHKGDTYTRWRWFHHGDAGTCRMHPECRSAMEQEADDEGGWLEFTPGDHERPAASTLAPTALNGEK